MSQTVICPDCGAASEFATVDANALACLQCGYLGRPALWGTEK